jgi:hypothetical protein
MSDDTKLYISVESDTGRLVVDGSMILWRELVGSLAAPPAETKTAPAEQKTGDLPSAEGPR